MSDKIISKVCAREIIDCRGWPTVQADVWVDGQLMGRAGLGGPNQEFVLGVSLEIGEISNVLVAAIDSDGTDGSTKSAGGITDQKTKARARVEGVDLFAFLGHHDAGTALDKGAIVL